MSRFSTPARRAVLVCVGLLAMASGPAFAANTCPEVKFADAAGLTVPDFDPAPGGGWTRHSVTVNGQPSSPKPNQGGVYQWTQESGPAVTLVNANTPKVDFLAPDVLGLGDVVVLRLTVAGCDGSASDTYSVNVFDRDDVNAAPHAEATASPASPTEGQLVALDGSSSWDPDNNPLTYSWTQVGTQTVVLANANQAQASFIAPNVAATTTLKFQLVVSDGALTSSTEVLVNVQWTNDPPVAVASCPANVNEGAPVTLNGSASSDSDSGIASYHWQQLVGLPVVEGVVTWTTASVSFNAPSLGYMQTGLVPFRLTVTDANDASSSATCYVMIHDITPPIISGAQDRTIEAMSAAGATVNLGTSAFDAVDGDLSFRLACTPPSGLFPFGTTNVGCSVKDSANNPASAAFTVTIADTTAPVITAPLSVAVEAAGPGGAIVNFEATTTDAVDGPGQATCSPASGSEFVVGTSYVECTAADAHGNAAVPATIVIDVFDHTKPELQLPAPMELEATSSLGAVATFTASASDIVDVTVPVTCSHASGDTFALGTTTVECQAADAAGNIATGSFTVKVQDTTAPSIDQPADIAAEAVSAAGATVAYVEPIAIDIVDGQVGVICTPVPDSTFPLGTTPVHCNATDTRGNSAGVTFNVTVRDTTPPALAGLVADFTVEATSAAGATVSYVPPTATDLVDGIVPVSCAPASATAFGFGETLVTCSATDARDNVASDTFTVTVVDTKPPVISDHADVGPVEATGPSGAAVSFLLPTAVDLVDGAVGVTCLPASGSTFSIGTHAVNCTATDSRGNTATRTFQATVQDKTPPTLQYTGDVTVVVEGGNNSAVVNYTKPTAWDLVDGWNTTVTCTPESGNSFPAGSNTVECTASDSRGNTTTGSFQVHVHYPWSGFLQPVDNPSVLNTAKAGSAIPVKFSLGGYYGMDIFDDGPASGVIGCSETSGNAIDQTVTAGNSSLQYDAGTKQYIYVWKTEKAWAGQCRILQFKLQDDTVRFALFKFK